MPRLILISCIIALSLAAACAAPVQIAPPTEHPVTTLTRFEGSPIERREIQANSPGALAVARVLYLIDRELREPSAELRSARDLLNAVAEREPETVGLAEETWEALEQSPAGEWRRAFREFGLYRNPLMPAIFQSMVTPASLEAAVRKILRQHDDSTPRGRLLAAWRHFSPRITDRRANYLASAWTFELETTTRAKLGLAESLLGPFARTAVRDPGGSWLDGPPARLEGYYAPAPVMELVAPGRTLPVQSTIDALVSALKRPGARIPVAIDGDMTRVTLDEIDARFLEAALTGLKEGCSDLGEIPLACRRVQVTFDYLVENAEARATLGFRLGARGWILELFEYEPAAAALLGAQGARLDLISLVRAMPIRPANASRE